MSISKRFTVTLLITLLTALAARAQNPHSDNRAVQTPVQDVRIIIQSRQALFTALKAVEEMRLQVFNQSGEMVFDSGAVAAGELNWPCLCLRRSPGRQ